MRGRRSEAQGTCRPRRQAVPLDWRVRYGSDGEKSALAGRRDHFLSDMIAAATTAKAIPNQGTNQSEAANTQSQPNTLAGDSPIGGNFETAKSNSQTKGNATGKKNVHSAQYVAWTS